MEGIAQPSKDIERFMKGVEAYCLKGAAITPDDLQRAKEQIAAALNKRSEQGDRQPLKDHEIKASCESPKIKSLRESLTMDVPHDCPSLAGRVTV